MNEQERPEVEEVEMMEKETFSGDPCDRCLEPVGGSYYGVSTTDGRLLLACGDGCLKSVKEEAKEEPVKLTMSPKHWIGPLK